MRNKQYDFRTGFIDLLLSCFAAIVVLFIISTALINPTRVVKQEGVRKDAEYVIEINWPQNIDCDVDLWVMDPAKNTVSYQRKDAGLMHLERDDLGYANDQAREGQVVYKSKFNGEITTIRGLVPGRYSVSVHLFNCRLGGRELKPGSPMILPVAVKITKLNPNLLIVHESTVEFQKIWEEIPVISWTMNELGYPIDWDTTPRKLIKIQKNTGMSPY